MPFNSIQQTRMHTRKHEPEDKTKGDNDHRRKNNSHDNIANTSRLPSQSLSIDTNTRSALIMSPALNKQYHPHNPVIAAPTSTPKAIRLTPLTPNTATATAKITTIAIMTATSTPTRSLSRVVSANARRQLQSPNIRSKRVILNPSAISLVLLCHLISSQLFTQTTIMTTTTTGRQLDGSDSSNINNNLNNQYNQINQSGSLFQLVAANPAPVASPSSARTATSVSHRVPPINGSMFGKRSLDNLGKTMAPKKRQPEPYVDNTATTTTTSQTDNYNDIITETIENFLAKNSANSPDEAAVAFCRMIVYECNQMLKVRGNGNRRGLRR